MEQFTCAVTVVVAVLIAAVVKGAAFASATRAFVVKAAVSGSSPRVVHLAPLWCLWCWIQTGCWTPPRQSCSLWQAVCAAQRVLRSGLRVQMCFWKWLDCLSLVVRIWLPRWVVVASAVARFCSPGPVDRLLPADHCWLPFLVFSFAHRWFSLLVRRPWPFQRSACLVSHLL